MIPHGVHTSSYDALWSLGLMVFGHSSLPDLVDVDIAIGGPCEQGVAIRTPGERDAPRDAALRRVCGAQLVQDILVLKVPNLDRGVRGRAEPVVLRAEGQRVDRAAGIQGVEVLPVVDVPEHRGAILTARGAERAVRRYRASVHDAGV